MQKSRVENKKIVLVGGCFDILHYGHVYFLKEARRLGNYLIVALESDARIKKLKGRSRPIHNQNQRKEILESLMFVDEVIILRDKMTDEDYRNLVIKISPNVIAVTEDDPIIEKKLKHAQKVGAKVVKINKIRGISTTRIIKKITPS